MVRSRAKLVAKGRPPGSPARAVRQPARRAVGPRAGKSDGKREKNKAKNRAQILSAAQDVFTELGYDAATVRDIIRRTRLASGTFYNYFSDKESVFRALLAESEERRTEWLKRAEIRTTSYESYLADSFRAYFEFVASDRTTFELLRRNSSTLRAFADDPVVIGELARLRATLREKMDRGLIPTLDTEYLASAMYGISFEVAVIMVDRNPVDVQGATRFATDLFVGCLERAGGFRRNAGRGTNVRAAR